jgi:Glu-tRNA(Gln) amidotransferase subunit E-like FAD-binding protein
VESRLTAAFLGQAGLAVRRPAARWWVPVATWAAAAAAVVALAMFLARDRQVVPAHRTTSNRVQLAAVEPPADLETLGDSSDADGDFIPMPNAARIEPNEDLNLVRVEVPRSAMIALGYAVSEDRASESVEAEVVLGPDGLARAVRFLE